MNLEDKITECENLYEKEDFRALIEKCDEILDEFPDNQNAIGYKGFALCALGEDGEALKVLERGVELYPDNYYLKNNLAIAYYMLGEYETSLKLCEEGLEIKDFEWLSENKFKNLIRLDRYDEAIEFEKTLNHDIDRHSVFMEDGMAEHELNYYCHVFKDDPDDFPSLTMIKMICSKLGRKPEVGDYYLKWIDAIKLLDDETEVCPDCGGKLIRILRGYPSREALEAAERGEIILGGCDISRPNNYHCKACGHEFNIGNGKVNIDFENHELGMYAQFEMLLLDLVLRNDSGNCVGLDEISDGVFIFDEELDAFISHLTEIGYIEQKRRVCIRRA